MTKKKKTTFTHPVIVTTPSGKSAPPPPVRREPAPKPTPAPKPPGVKPPIHPEPKPLPSPGSSTGLSGGQTSALDLMTATLQSWGLDSLIPDLKKLITAGDTSPDTLSLALSQTSAYKQRFAGNAERVANGLSELSPAQYIALEEQYHNVLQSYGLPQGFYDRTDDFTSFIGKDISPTELRDRAQVAHDQYMYAPDYVKSLWGTYFGTKGDAIAAILDPNVATQVIQDRGMQVGIGGAAASQGLSVSQPRAQQLSQAGVTLDGARKAYAQIAQSLPTDQAIAQRFGTSFGQAQEENDLLLGDAKAGQQRQAMYSEEQALFHGTTGLDQNTLSTSQGH